MKVAIENIFDTDYVVDFDYRVTVEEWAGDRDDPGHPMEYELTFLGAVDDADTAIGVPDWLEAQILEFLHESDRVYDAIKADHKPF